MAAISQLLSNRSEAERISAQRRAYVRLSPDGVYQALDRDGWPIEYLNSYLRDLSSRSDSVDYPRNTAFNFVRLLKNAGAAGFDVLFIPYNLFQAYFNVRRLPQDPKKKALKLSSARAELARIHGVYKWAREQGYIEHYPYPVKIIEASIRTHGQSFVVPKVLPRLQKQRIKYLPPLSHFRRFTEALNVEAAFVCWVMRKTGLRICEVQEFARELARRERPKSGVAIVMIFRKGSKSVKKPVYVPAEVAQRCDLYFQNRTQFLNKRGTAWTKKTLSSHFTAASKVVYGPDHDGSNITAHTLRHAYASAAFLKLSQLFHAGLITEEPLLVVQELLAHASYQTTWETYIHMFAKDENYNEEDFKMFDLGVVKDVLAVMQITQFAENKRMNDGIAMAPESFLPLQ